MTRWKATLHFTTGDLAQIVIAQMIIEWMHTWAQQPYGVRVEEDDAPAPTAT